jgi:hypothetical protein
MSSGGGDQFHGLADPEFVLGHEARILARREMLNLNLPKYCLERWLGAHQGGGMASEARRGMARLMLRQPEWREALQRWALQDARLRDLVEDYEAAYAALDYLAHAPIVVAPVRLKEYRSLASMLEEDILSIIKSKASRSG